LDGKCVLFGANITSLKGAKGEDTRRNYGYLEKEEDEHVEGVVARFLEDRLGQ